MIKPTLRALERHGAISPGVMYTSGSPTPQGNPRHWKYYWQVFSLGSAWEEAEFFEHAPKMCNAELLQELQRIRALGQSCFVYGFRRPRADTTNPWDMDSPRWAGMEFAVGYDQDTDPAVFGDHR